MPDAAITKPRGPDERARVIAHRGAWNPAPQNSLAAFEQAIADGADAIELDVRRSADNRLVVVHDPRIGVRPVGRLDHSALRQRMAPGQAPELDDVLSTLAGRIAFDIELKEDGYVGEAMEVVARHLSPEHYVVTSFQEAVLPQVREAVPAARTGLLLASRRPERRLERRVAQSKASFIAPHHTLVRGPLLDWAAERDLEAWVWTVNETRTLRQLFSDRRVGAVITDRTREAVAEARRRPDGPVSPAV
jgi:glycerophosphoryl diester phosphodiesterase